MNCFPRSLLLVLTAATSLAACSLPSRPVPVVAPCPAIPPLPAEIAEPSPWRTALQNLDATLTRLGLPAPSPTPSTPPASPPTSESAPREIDDAPIVEPDLRDPADFDRRRRTLNATFTSALEAPQRRDLGSYATGGSGPDLPAGGSVRCEGRQSDDSLAVRQLCSGGTVSGPMTASGSRIPR